LGDVEQVSPFLVVALGFVVLDRAEGEGGDAQVFILASRGQHAVLGHDIGCGLRDVIVELDTGPFD
jgi:hypothetical protein